MTRLLRGRPTPAPRSAHPAGAQPGATEASTEAATEPGATEDATQTGATEAAAQTGATQAAEPAAPGRHRTRAGRHRAAPGARRAAPARRRGSTARRGARYAAAGLLALTGAVAAPSLTPDPAAGVVAVRTAARPAPRPATVRPLAARPAAKVLPTRRATRSRWVTRTVGGQVLRGRATWYGPGFAGRRTASGEVFRPDTALTAAHRTLPFGTRLRVCHGRRCVVVRINDRGPFGNAILDLSRLAARRIGIEQAGIVHVTATVLHTKRVRVAA